MKIAFIGGGNMAAALVAGLAGKVTPGANIHVVDPNPAALEALHAGHGVTTAPSIDAAVSAAEVIVLAVKPQSMREAVAPLVPLLAGAPHAPLVLSIAAGIRSADLSRWLGGYGAIVRCMPNTPALIGMGIAGLVASAGVTQAQRLAADQVLKAVGGTVWLDDEAQIDAVTGVSGSGPAYVFYFIEAMQQAAVELGLTAGQGLELAKATFTGAAQLAAQSQEPVSVLRERVTSKGGTTYAALTSMEESGVKAAIVNAVKAAAARGKELGEQMGRDG
ncbi:pyrroline-5-carboxylate reductase [Pseudoduganella albidiflava]|uniref:Pyrroline-5-carboxylate reductase n=1 Tax=Pseudoduganella albidiflava TaxID=321983 RepID=A0A411X3I8_9BURK|nr:pyrroline-5-carboxylate reductase [Pseudoduganella albidiflava]QBI03569.1 pyrroline-5-carboxylate reductase [Pseudoduganella albidiflava]GGY51079.1 pyrroline-5-carboxylate reductase [Pseudoduganella albidiflava]